MGKRKMEENASEMIFAEVGEKAFEYIMFVERRWIWPRRVII
jgi:hypothetical protein